MTKKISQNEVERIAHLAHLSLNSAQKNNFAHQLGDVLLYVKQLTEKELSTAKKEEKNSPTREDKVEGSPIGVEKLLENVPQKIETNIKVPAVLGGEDG